MVQVLDGKASITIGNKNFAVNSGETIIMPSGIQHALQAVEKFKMLLTVVKH
jgi:quercetin dioxygenase-like cupin family protein